ncbi:SRPBCC family protein [Ferruginibacter sp. SUN106]|uniref:SRPBCC family protein n=1 Tax=Ferruginibacter sp. SUN106 TaxID=2978348 RepID=UPI003D3636A1
MTILLYILSVIGAIIALFLLLALVTKKDFRIEKQIVIDKPKAEVFNYLKLIKNQEKYSVWVMKDPDVKIVYSGTDGTVGFISSWTSDDKNVGIGAQEIIKLAEGESMDVEVRFKKPFEATNYAHTDVTAISATQTKVSNVFTGKQKFPLNVMNLFMDKLIGKDMLQNLVNMKNNVEGQ